jgi:hypothetical protein
VTSSKQRQTAEEIVKEIAGLPGVADATVDDFDDAGGFSLFARLTTIGTQFIQFTVPLAGLIPKFKAIAKKHGAAWEWHQPPLRQYSYAGPRHKKYWDGYDTDAYKVSIRILS